MEVYSGKSVSGGIAVGELFFYSRQTRKGKSDETGDTLKQLERFEQARTSAKEELLKTAEKAAVEAGTEVSQIFQVHAMILDDSQYLGAVREKISVQGLSAKEAVLQTGDTLVQQFAQMEDEVFRARAEDIRDVTDRVAAALEQRKDGGKTPAKPSILAAEDLSPGETIRMDRNSLLGLVTHAGSAHSHTAILARTMGIPALTGIAVQKTWEGKRAVIDGENGQLLLDPDKETLSQIYKRMEQRRQEEKKRISVSMGREESSAAGRKVDLFANAGNLADVEAALELNAQGIGLFRSEFLFLEREHFPSEEEQFEVYSKAAKMLNGRRLTIRTMDIGAEKQADYFSLPREENPALGYRGVRISLEQPELFKTQLRAILRAGLFGSVSGMYPMIASVWEVKRCKEILKEAQEELDDRGIPYGKIQQGIMIETPAAAILSDELSKEVDFFSIGTNDLTQYLLAADRQNGMLEHYYDPRHPALLRLIERVIKNGHAGGCRVGICGELAADPTLTEIFLRMGIDELSVSPPLLPALRGKVHEAGSALDSAGQSSYQSSSSSSS